MRALALLVSSLLVLAACEQSESQSAKKETPTTPAKAAAPRASASPATDKPKADERLAADEAEAKAAPKPKKSQLPRGATAKALRFKKGESSATLKDAVVRGESHWIEFGAKEGQQLDVTISALEDNAVFGLFVVAPDQWQDRLNAQGNVAFMDIETKPAGKVEGLDKERTSFSGKLPAGANEGLSRYAIHVGGTRGNATYELERVASISRRRHPLCIDAGNVFGCGACSPTTVGLRGLLAENAPCAAPRGASSVRYCQHALTVTIK